MNTEKTLQIASSSSEDTFEIGERFGRACKGGEVFLLVSDLGGGKTTFTKGLAAGLACKAVITSPTFTVSRSYDCRDDLKLHHFDFYRLQEAGVVGQELEEITNDPKAVTVVEWGDIVAQSLPLDFVRINLNRTHEGEDIRDILCTIPKSYEYIVENL